MTSSTLLVILLLKSFSALCSKKPLTLSTMDLASFSAKALLSAGRLLNTMFLSCAWILDALSAELDEECDGRWSCDDDEDE